MLLPPILSLLVLVLPASANLSLFQRSNSNCPATYTSCAAEGVGAACCPANTLCTRDDAQNIACCPVGAKCTGIIASPGESTSSSRSPAGATSSTSTSTPVVTAEACADGYAVTVVAPGGGVTAGCATGARQFVVATSANGGVGRARATGMVGMGIVGLGMGVVGGVI